MDDQPKPSDATAASLSQEIAALGNRLEPPTQSVPTVAWLDRARNKIRRQELVPQLDRDLQVAFGPDAAERVTVSEVFAGYRFDEEEKLVLGVQVAGGEQTSSHIVKLGRAKSVRRDYDGWSRCLAQHSLASRILLSVRGRELPNERYAAIYQDAYRLFGTDTDAESPKSLESAVERAALDGKPDCRSVERVLAEIYAELFRCCYHSCREDRARAATFFRDRLEFGGAASAWACWRDGPDFRTLRRDALWLVTARDKPDAEHAPGYLDPFDYVAWAFANGRTPPTLVGRSHGDLHGRNILVGLFRGEAMQPAVFDYGDMSDQNVLVWDFVKLEMELKCRVLPRLFDAAARQALRAAVGQVRPPIAGSPRLSIDEQEVAQRVDRLEFAYQFETALATLTRGIVSQDAAARPLPGELRAPTGHAALDRALLLCLRLRQEAAYWLGFQVGRPAQWREEYYFALAVYGLLIARWPVEWPHLEWALVSAGVAVAQLQEMSNREAGVLVQQRRKSPPAEFLAETLPSHLIPLAWAHGHWKENNYVRACEVLESAAQHFPNAVSLLQESALCLAARGDLVQAKQKIDSLRRLCHVFRDYETLCRLGRILKDSGDQAWQADKHKHRKFLADHPLAWQLFQDAQQLYTEAFEFSRHYYPGGNAATLMLLTGDAAAQELARDVLSLCQVASAIDLEERYWLSATAGEAHLVAGQKSKAFGHYDASFENPCAQSRGMLQPVYDQLCRLHWALGRGSVQRIVELMSTRGLLAALEPGPFENCGRP